MLAIMAVRDETELFKAARELLHVPGGAVDLMRAVADVLPGVTLEDGEYSNQLGWRVPYVSITHRQELPVKTDEIARQLEATRFTRVNWLRLQLNNSGSEDVPWDAFSLESWLHERWEYPQGESSQVSSFWSGTLPVAQQEHLPSLIFAGVRRMRSLYFGLDKKVRFALGLDGKPHYKTPIPKF